MRQVTPTHVLSIVKRVEKRAPSVVCPGCERECVMAVHTRDFRIPRGALFDRICKQFKDLPVRIASKLIEPFMLHHKTGRRADVAAHPPYAQVLPVLATASWASS